MNKKIVFIPVGLFFTSIGHSQKKKTLINMRLKITMRKVISFFVFALFHSVFMDRTPILLQIVSAHLELI